MPIEINQAVGTGVKVTVRADDIKEAVEQAAFFGELPQKCVCGSTALSFTCRRPESYVYYGMKCKECYREFSFGQTREGGRLFPKYDDGWKTLEEKKAMANGSGGSGGGGYQDTRGQQQGKQAGSRTQTGGGGRPRPPADDDDDTIPF